jgi:hypothetical protein
VSDEFVSRLPVFRAKRSNDFPAFLIVYCGQEDCPGTVGRRPFLVAEKEWMRPRRVYNEKSAKLTTIVGRSCPYCFRAGRLPRRSDLS